MKATKKGTEEIVNHILGKGNWKPSQEQLYSEKQLIEFGNYLLSDRRRETVFEKGDAKIVHHADLQNFFNK